MKKETILKILSENIRMERFRKRYSQDKLSEMAGISQKYLSMIELGQVNPSITVVINLCKALGIGINELLNGI